MPKAKIIKFPAINLDLLRPQSSPEKLFSRLLRWLLSTGRYIFIFVEALVLIVFISRFKLDDDLASKKEAIEQQIPYIESLKPVEILIRQTQLKLSAISSFYSNYADYPQILKRIAAQTPIGVKIISLNLEKNGNKVTVNLNAQAENNNALSTFIQGLKDDQSFSDVAVTSIGFEKGSLNFSVSAQANSNPSGGKSS
ncbi:MAG: Uncharacterized protein G01um10147_537 [Microgenomates group bacterium Gr01-1014_7]|nr:MAG: Uncharacterized protein G01um10147_537 [Microgenomates group bacterium Gr01-1014_7]